ncbi:cupin domain-containing protein [Aerolutibacter ruishenii]|uniref:Mannose-6-phosphate isomerase-like protein (Cupin superfamily) n=1 Tax=Aerolutibacter ruishenii TaxID=686800 RepID=A0A562LI85_9GAMM|nr:cupin domain-containing protein [Lysobacter ruishenii]TWI07301.1 mannose-6-phosphate isomerase-like protein (cupin superfamily) [Lysobacter ruishenii]
MKALALLFAVIPMAAYGHEPKPQGDALPNPQSDYVVRLEQMTAIEAGKGEKIHLLRGSEHGFKGLSFILTETAPGGGPPLHTHESEEAHVLTSGTMSYVIGGQTFVVSAPYILRVPANTPHTFINAGKTPLALTAVFDSANYTFKPIAANPLQQKPDASP